MRHSADTFQPGQPIVFPSVSHLLDFADDAIWVRNTENRILYWNGGAERRYGWSKHEAIGRTLGELIEPKLPESEENIRRTLERTGQWCGDVQHTKRNGTHLHISSRWTAQRNEAGELETVLEINRDITDRRLEEESLHRSHAEQRLEIQKLEQRVQDAEAALSRTETRLRLALDSGQIGMFDWDFVQNQIEGDSTTRKLFGNPFPDEQGLRSLSDWSGRLHPEDAKPSAAAVAEALRKRCECHLEFRVMWPDNTVRWLHIRGRAHYNERGWATRMTGVVMDVTERMVWTEALQKSEQHFRILADSIPHPIFLLAADGSVLYCNRVAYEYGGATPDSTLGQAWKLNVHPDDLDSAQERFKHAYSTGRFENENRVLTADGTYRWNLVRAFPRYGKNHEIDGWFGTCTDIHDLKVALEEVRKFRYITDHASDSLALIDRNGRYLYANEAMCTMLGYSAEEMLQGVTLQSTHPGAEGSLFSVLGGAQLGRTCVYETNARTKAGESIPVEVSCTALFIAGEPALFTVERNITERKRGELAIREHEQHLSIALESASLGAWVLNCADGAHELTASPRYNLNLGHPADSVATYERLIEHLHPDDRETVVQNVQMAVEKGVEYDVEYRTYTPDGTLQWILSRGRPITDASGKIVKVIGVNQNITHQKSAEQALRESSAKFQRLAEAIPTIVFTSTPDGVPDYFNQKWLQYIGEVDARLYASEWMRFLHPYDRDRTETEWNRVLETGDTFEIEHRIRRADGVFRWHISRSVPIRTSSGAIERWFSTLTDVHDLKEAQQKAEVSEGRVRTIVNNAPVVLWSIDRDGIYTVCQGKGLQALGMSPSELVGKSVADVHSGDPVIQDHLRRASEGESFTEDVSFRGAWFRTHYAPILDRADRVDGVVGVSTEVTKLKRTEEALVSSEARFRRVFESSILGMVVFNRKGEIMDANAAFLRMMEFSREGLRDKKLHWESGVEITETLAERSGCESLELELITESGKRVPVLIACTNLERSADEGIAFVLDISERKKVQSELLRSEERFRLAESGTGIGSWEWQLGNHRYRFSPGYRAMLGYGPDDAFPNEIDQWVEELLHPDDLAGLRRAENLSLQDPSVPYVCEFRLKHRHGDWRWILSRGTVQRDASGVPIRMLGIHVDITEQKKMLHELERLTDELKVSNAELERFAYIASHDLKEPLRNVSTYLQLLERMHHDTIDEKSKRYIDGALEGSRRMIELVDGLMRFFRVGSSANRFRPVDCNEVVRCAISNLASAIQESEAVIDLENLPTIHADREQLIQVFQNLLSNSLKFRRPGVTPHVWISAKASGPYTEFRISDNGIGMRRESTQSIFQMFKRLHRRDEFPGEGIGLALCKKVVECHGGRITVESEPGRGSCFQVLLPT